MSKDVTATIPSFNMILILLRVCLAKARFELGPKTIGELQPPSGPFVSRRGTAVQPGPSTLLIAGETNPAKLASLADRRVKASPEKLREAVRGRVTKHHRFLLRLHLNQIDALDAAMATVDAQVEANLGPFRTAVELILSIPGTRTSARKSSSRRSAST